MRRALWKKLPLGTRMERLGGKLCPLDGRVEDHEHVFRHCMFSVFMQSTVRKAFGMVEAGGGGEGGAEPLAERLPSAFHYNHPGAAVVGGT